MDLIRHQCSLQYADAVGLAWVADTMLVKQKHDPWVLSTVFQTMWLSVSKDMWHVKNPTVAPANPGLRG